MASKFLQKFMREQAAMQTSKAGVGGTKAAPPGKTIVNTKTTDDRKEAAYAQPYIARKDSAQSTASPYAAAAQRVEAPKPESGYKRGGLISMAKDEDPFIRAIIDTQNNKTEEDELRWESRMRTQLAKGVSPEELNRKAEIQAQRAYQPTLEDMERESQMVQQDLKTVEQLLGMASVAQEMSPGPEVDRQMKGLREWRDSLKARQDQIGTQYYCRENEEKAAALSEDQEGRSRVQAVEDILTDLRALGEVAAGQYGDQKSREALMAKYGLSERELEVQAPALIQGLQEDLEKAKEEVKAAGYNYDRMVEYQNRKEQIARAIVGQQHTEEFAEKHPVLASAASILTSPVQGVDYLAQLVKGYGHSDTAKLESYVPANVYEMHATNFVRNVRGTVARGLEEKHKLSVGNQNIASFLYQTGMSMGDFLFNSMITGNFSGGLGGAGTELGKKAAGDLSLAIMGSAAAANTTAEAIGRGLSNRQAYTLGAIAGAAEIITEKVSLETLLDKTALNKSARGYLLKNVLAEGSEEIASDLINWAADVLVSKNKSQWRQAIEGYMDQGMGKKEAFQTALKDQIISMGWSGLGGGLSGGVMAGGSIAVNSYLDRGFTMGTEVTQGQKNAAKEGGEMKLSLKEYAGKDLSKDSSIYTYDFLTSLPDMDVTFLPEVSTIRDENGRVDQSIVVRKGMENARSVGTERDGMVFVRNLYTGKQLQITADSIRHGLHGNLNRLLTNAKLGAVIGDVIKNAVPINALKDKAEGVSGTYAMAGYATDEAGREFVAIVTVEQYEENIIGFEAYDVAHAVSGRQKRGERVDTKSQGFYPSTNASTINIADFLETVKSTHQSILPQDVLDHFGETRNSGGYYSGETKFSLRGAEEGEDGKGHFTQDDDPLIQDIWRLFGKDGTIDEAEDRPYQGDDPLIQDIWRLFGKDRTVDEAEDRPYQGDDPLIQDIWRLFGKDGTVDEAEDRPYQDDDLFIQAIVDMDRGSRFAQEDGTGSGLVYDDYVRTTLSTKTAERVNTIAKALGVRVRFVDSVENGAANASISGTDILVEKGNKNPVLFLLGHEWLHRVQALASAEYRVFREAITDEISAKAEEVISLYERYGRSISYEEALDEAAADYAGRMLEDGRLLDEFIERHRTDRTLLERFVEAIREIMGKLTGREKEQARTVEQKLSAALDAAAAQAEALGGKENAATAGGETRYLIKYDRYNRPFVVVESDILAGVPQEQWVSTIKKNLQARFPQGINVSGRNIKINAQTTSEITSSEYSKWLRDNSPEIYENKFRATDSADEILIASRDYVGEGLKHPRKDNIREFARGTVLIRIGENDYTADVVVATTKSGSMVLYDLVNILPTKIETKNRPEQPLPPQMG